MPPPRKLKYRCGEIAGTSPDFEYQRTAMETCWETDWPSAAVAVKV